MNDRTTDKLLLTLMNCIAACEHCASACLTEKDPGRLAGCIRLDHDCAEACTLAARFLARGSEHTAKAMDLCIALCEACAEECGHHDHDHCRACREACLTCAAACKEHDGVHA